MKTIATAAVLMMLAAPVWADEAEKQTNDPANTEEPIILSEAEMDGVTAGTISKSVDSASYSLFTGNSTDSSASSTVILELQECSTSKQMDH